jgi:hypothetical protein
VCRTNDLRRVAGVAIEYAPCYFLAVFDVIDAYFEALDRANPDIVQETLADDFIPVAGR